MLTANTTVSTIFGAVATLRNLNELDHVKQVIRRKLPTMGLKSYIWTGVRNIPENLNFTETQKSPDKTNQQNPSSAAPARQVRES